MNESPNRNASQKLDGIANEKLDAVVPKLIQPLRMLSSNTDGEAIAAVRAILRLLAAAGLDIHTLVSRVEHGKGDSKLGISQMQEIYEKGYADGHTEGVQQGRRSAVIAAAMPMSLVDTSDVGPGVNGYDWIQIAQYCTINKHRISRDRDREFVDSVFEQLTFGRRSISAPQAKWLRDIFNQRFAGRIE
jgi:hypothetical protein